MTEDRRDFLKGFLKEATKSFVAGFREGTEQAQTQQDFDEFFDSYESSYALTLNYPDEILIESARKEGIDVEGREKIDIARELFKLKGGWF